MIEMGAHKVGLTGDNTLIEKQIPRSNRHLFFDNEMIKNRPNSISFNFDET
jgi:hypothetical protein